MVQHGVPMKMVQNGVPATHAATCCNTCFNMLYLCNMLHLPVYMALKCVHGSYKSGSCASRRMLNLRVYERRRQGMRIWLRTASCGVYMGATCVWLRRVYALGLCMRAACFGAAMLHAYLCGWCGRGAARG
jgi:hypothetical protein